MSVQLRELVAAGLVTRVKDAADKRYVSLHPTEESKRIKALLEGEWAEALTKASERLLPEERDQIAASLPALERLASFLAEPEKAPELHSLGRKSLPHGLQESPKVLILS